MIRRVARTLLRPLRTFNRWWIDRLDPDWPRAEDPAPAERAAAPAPAAPRPAPAPAPAAARRPADGPVSVWAEATPNPDAIKFVCSVPVVDTPTTWREGDRTSDPVGQALVAIPGVRSAFAVGDFVTVTRTSGADWDVLRPAVESALTQALGPA